MEIRCEFSTTHYKDAEVQVYGAYAKDKKAVLSGIDKELVVLAKKTKQFASFTGEKVKYLVLSTLAVVKFFLLVWETSRRFPTKLFATKSVSSSRRFKIKTKVFASVWILLRARQKWKALLTSLLKWQKWQLITSLSTRANLSPRS